MNCDGELEKIIKIYTICPENSDFFPHILK